MNQKEPNLERIREILLEPQLSHLSKKMEGLENKVADMNPSKVDAVKKEMETIKNDVKILKMEMKEIKNVIVGLNRKFSNAFSMFTKLGDSLK